MRRGSRLLAAGVLRLLRRLRRDHPALLELSVRVLFMIARPYRQTLVRGVAFIGVTGSSGKTMTKELIVAVLSTRLTGHKSPLDLNRRRFTATTIPLCHRRPSRRRRAPARVPRPAARAMRRRCRR